jgi:hypothetical protein
MKRQAATSRPLTDAEEQAAYDRMSAKDRAALASHSCDRCGAALLIMEIGGHYRRKHPDDAPRVTRIRS